MSTENHTLFDLMPKHTEPNYGKRFDGEEYIPSQDQRRLAGQLKRIYEVMKDGKWRTIQEVAQITNYPANSIQAQLRHLRKERFGSYLVEKRRVTTTGLYEYRVGAKGEGEPRRRTLCCPNCKTVIRTWNSEND